MKFLCPHNKDLQIFYKDYFFGIDLACSGVSDKKIELWSENAFQKVWLNHNQNHT